MGTRTWVQILLVVAAHRLTVIPRWSYTNYPDSSFAITDWSWLPAGVLPTSNFCLSSWTTAPSAPDDFYMLQSGNDILKLIVSSTVAEIELNGSAIVTATGTYELFRWFFMVINVNSGMTYLLVAKRNNQAFVTAQSTGTFTLTSASTVRGAQSGSVSLS